MSIEHPTGRECVEVRCSRHGITVATQLWTIVFAGNPKNVGAFGVRGNELLCGQGAGEEMKEKEGEEEGRTEGRTGWKACPTWGELLGHEERSRLMGGRVGLSRRGSEGR